MERVTVVTVCYNAEKEIKRTIDSVLKQKYIDYEYLIIDGASKDRTVQIVNEYRSKFAKLGIQYTIISEPDKGIYDAMNKGINYANGEWIIYMNAGDEFFDSDVLKNVFENNKYDSDVLYGRTLYASHNHYKMRVNKAIDDIVESMPFCHQSVFVRKTIMDKFRFNCEYKIAADYDFFVRAYKAKVKFAELDAIISVFDATGTSNNQHTELWLEYYEISQKNCLKQNRSKLHILIQTKVHLYCRRIVESIAPGIKFSERRGWYTDKYKAANMRRA